MDQQTVLFFLALIGAAAGLWFRIDARIATAVDKADKRIDAAAAQNLLLQAQLSEFRLEVARDYVRGEAFQRTEERLIASIDKLAAQLDKVINRLDALAIQQAKAEEGARSRAPPDTIG